jgi:carbonic anhydrase
MPSVSPHRRSLRWVSLLGAAGLLLGGPLLAQTPPTPPTPPTAPNAPAGADRMSQQLREAIERANNQRPAPGSRAASATVPGVTLNVETGGAVRVAPTPPTAAASAANAASAPRRSAVAAPPPAPTPAAGVHDEVAPARAAAPAAERRRPAAAPTPASPASAMRATAPAPTPAVRRVRDADQRQFERARAIANGLPIPVHARLPSDLPPEERKPAAPPPPWSYSGAGGPQAWAQLQPEYALCGSGRRQAPIHIESRASLQGPNEALLFSAQPSSATVLHDGRTIRVQVEGDNRLQVRGTSYRLESFDFKHPAEEMVDHRGFAMGMHLHYRSAQGDTAIVAVLLEEGEANPFIDKVWTYIPLDAGDSVRMPAGWLDVSSALPRDQRYYQFFGSLTQPPCTEGVLWMVLKQPVTLSPAQLRLFAQMFPANARPVQALNGRIVRDAH